MTNEAQLLTEIRDLCAAMLAETRAEGERQAEVRAQYAQAVANQRKFQRFAFAVLLVMIGMVAFYLYG